MRELTLTLAITLGGSLLVALIGWAVLRWPLRGRSVTAHIAVLLLMTVLAVLAGILGASWQMFISERDLRVLLVVVAVAAVVSLGAGLWAGQRLARASVWAAEARERERRAEASRRDLVAWVSHDLRTPLAGMRAMRVSSGVSTVKPLARIAARCAPRATTDTSAPPRDR